VPVDFDALVLAPCMNTFAVSFTVEPVASQPRGVPYAARGVWAVRNVDVDTQEGITSTEVRTLGVRISEFPVLPIARDRILFQDAAHMITDVDEDGQGGAVLTLAELDGYDPEYFLDP
jgi:hypothetical protein